MIRRLLLLCAMGWATVGSGCAFGRPAMVQNPFFVPAANEEQVWERTVDVVHDYFEIERENKLDGVIETQPKVGASIVEPWHRDTPGVANRLESTLQSIRRRAYINIMPTNGGYLVGVEVYKELEDTGGYATNTSTGAATFQPINPLQRDLTLVVDQPPTTGWIVKGRDESLESEMLISLQRAFARSR